MWNLYTEPVSIKKELQLTTEPKEWQVRGVGRRSVKGNAAKGNKTR